MDLLDYTPDTQDIVITLAFKGTTLKNEDDTPMTITFYGPYSKEAKAIKHSMVDERIAKAEAGDDTKLTSAQVEELNNLALAKNIKSWDITFDKKKPKLTEKNAIDVITKAFWIKGLYDEAAEKTLGFMKG